MQQQRVSVTGIHTGEAGEILSDAGRMTHLNRRGEKGKDIPFGRGEDRK